MVRWLDYSLTSRIMLSASCYFRGNYMNLASAKSLLSGICAEPELLPDYWNILEPINRRFSHEHLNEVVAALVPNSIQLRSLVFFVRKRDPSFLLTVDLRLGPAQGSTPHNSINFDCGGDWNGGENVLARILPRSVLPRFPDYASVPDWQQDKDRYKEFQRSYTGKELVVMLRARQNTAPFGPYGCLADVHWFNYFGRVYVEAIGRGRLMAAGWERLEEIGEGLACYATEKIDDVKSRKRRSDIAKRLEEFVWSPGCKPDEKQLPNFDYSEQLSALPAEVLDKMKASAGSFRVHFAGLSAKDQEQAERLLHLDGNPGRG
jgi:hypothetical protein